MPIKETITEISALPWLYSFTKKILKFEGILFLRNVGTKPPSDWHLFQKHGYLSHKITKYN
jgi:hypothetical protein